MTPFKKSLSLPLGLLVLMTVAGLMGARIAAASPSHTSFNASCATTNYDPTSGQASCTIFTIPTGSQVVVQTVACTAEVAVGQGPAQADLIIPNGLTNYYFPLAMTKQSEGMWAITNQIQAYGSAPPSGTTSIGIFFRASLPNLKPPQGMNCTIAGYVTHP